MLSTVSSMTRSLSSMPIGMSSAVMFSVSVRPLRDSWRGLRSSLKWPMHTVVFSDGKWPCGRALGCMSSEDHGRT